MARSETCVLWMVVVLSVVGLSGCRGEVGASPDPPIVSPVEDYEVHDFVGTVGDTSVWIVAVDNEERPFWVQVSHAGRSSIFEYWDAEILGDGSVLMADLGKGLVALHPDGSQTQLLEEGAIGFLIALSPSGRLLAFQYPLEWGDNIVIKDGIGVYDLDTGERRLLFHEDPPGKFSLLGWLGQSVVFCGPDPAIILAVDPDGLDRVIIELPNEVRTFLPMRGGLLPYEKVGGGLVIVDLEDPEHRKEFPDAQDSRWTEAGLEVSIDGRRQVVLELDSPGGE